MNKTEFRLMRPDEIQEKAKTPSIALLPVGSLEWHGVHMNVGMDTMHSEKVAEIVAEALNAVRLPALYIGTEVKRTETQLKNLGFTGNENITGVDFPSNSIPSMYFPPEVFKAIMETEIKYLKSIGFHKIIILNGHGADKQIEILDALSNLYSDEKTKVINFLCFSPDSKYDLGHACLLETSIMMGIDSECVDKSKLPERTVPLKFKDYGFYDGKAISGQPNSTYTVEFDPRDATADIGKEHLRKISKECINLINSL